MAAGHIGAVAVGALVGSAVGLAVSCRKKTLFKKAHRMATSSDVELPVRLVDHVLRFLRRRMVASSIAGIALLLLVSMLFSADHGPRFWAKWLPWLVIALPLFVIAFTFLMTAWPRWRGSGAPRITHARKLSPRHAFTGTEYAVVVLGGMLSALGAAWGLRHFDAPASLWVAGIGSMCLSVVVWWSCVVATMNRPTSASDAVELSWDDMLRFESVRGLSVLASWGSATVILLTDWMATQTGAPQGTPWPLYLAVCAVAIVALVFQQGRQLWRRAWA